MPVLRYWLVVVPVFATFTACTSSVSPSIPSAPAARFAGAAHGGTSSYDLLYVTDLGDGTVYVYSYPQGALVQHLQFNLPQSATGDCIDDTGDVFVTGYNGHDVLVYARGAPQPKAILADPGYPAGCSIDPTTGDLAVANYFDRAAGPGNVAIWTNAKGFNGPSMVYSKLPFLEPMWCSYDDKGNLFVDGEDYSSHHVKLAELAKGASSFKSISLQFSLGSSPGKVTWDGKFISIAAGNTVYRLSFLGSKGRVVGTTQLPLAWNLQSYSIAAASTKDTQGRKLVGTAGGNIGVFGYPSGSGPTVKIAQNYPLDPVVSPYVARQAPRRGQKHLIFVTNFFTKSVTVYNPERKNPKPKGTITDGISTPSGDCLDQDLTLYVLDQSHDRVSEYKDGQTAPYQTITRGLGTPAFCAIDGAGNLWVTNTRTREVREYLKGSRRPGPVITDGISLPIGIAFDRSGDMYVANRPGSSGDNVQVYPPGGTSPIRTITNGITQPGAIAVDAGGTLYVANAPFNTVVEYKAGQNTPYQTIKTGLDYPISLTVDEAGTLFVGNLRSNDVVEYAPGSVKRLRKSIKKGIAQPDGLAFSPPVLP